MSDIRNLNIGTALCTIGGVAAGTLYRPAALFGLVLIAAGAGIKISSNLTSAARNDRLATSAWDTANGFMIGGGVGQLMRRKMSPLYHIFAMLGAFSITNKMMKSIPPYKMVAEPQSNQPKLSW